MHKKLIKKGQAGMLAPLTIQQGIQYSNNLLSTVPKVANMGKLVSKSTLLPALPNTKGIGALKGIGSSAVGGSSGVKGLFKGGSGVGAIGSGIGALSSILPDANNNELSNQINSGVQTAANAAIMSGNPIAMGVGAGAKALGFANKALSGLTGGATTINNADMTSDKILSSDLLALTPVGLINSLGKSKVSGSDTSLAQGIDMGYKASDEVKGAEYGAISKLFGGKKKMRARKAAAARVNRENTNKSIAVAQGKKDIMLAQNSAGDAQSRNLQQLSGGVNTNILAAKFGAKLQKIKNIQNKYNVIPSGALHARKHNLSGDISDNVTDKGIPVIMGDLSELNGIVVLQEGGEIEQTAEIEHSEVIFHLDLTKKIEDLMKKYNESEGKDRDRYAIEAGKLLTEELLENTVDNVGLLNE